MRYVFPEARSFLFIVFGAWIPVVTIFAPLSNRYQFPIIAALIVIVVGLTLFVGDGHDLRVATISRDQRLALRPIGFSHAVKEWKISSGWDAKRLRMARPQMLPRLSRIVRARSLSPERGAKPRRFSFGQRARRP